MQTLCYILKYSVYFTQFISPFADECGGRKKNQNYELAWFLCLLVSILAVDITNSASKIDIVF